MKLYLETRCDEKLGIRPLRISINNRFSFKYSIILKYYRVYNGRPPQTIEIFVNWFVILSVLCWSSTDEEWTTVVWYTFVT